MLISQSSRGPRLATLLAAACIVGLAGVNATAKDPSSDVKRALFPAQSALGLDSLALAEREATKALALDPDVTQTRLILAEVAWRRGDLGKARAEYQKAKDLGGAEAEAQAGLALVALASDDLATAEAAANAAIAADKGAWLANYALGRVLVAKGQHDAAFKLFEKGKGLKTRAERRDLFEAGMGLVALAENDVDGAQTNFIKARALAPKTIEHTMNLAAMYEATNQWGQVTIVLQQAEQQVGSSPLLTYRMGRAAEKQKQFNDALRLYQKSLAADSTFAPALHAVGHLYLLDARRTLQAVDVLTKAVAIKPTHASRLDLGIALTKLGKAAEAIPHLEAAQQENPSIETKVALARAYATADMLDKALPLYEDVDVRMEAPAADFVTTARGLIKAKRYDEAKTFLDQAAEKDPNNSDVHYQRGVIEMAAKNYPAALANFQKKSEMDPKYAPAFINAGYTHQMLKQQKEAVVAFRKATQAAPNSALAWNQLGFALVNDSTAVAQACFDRALAADPANAEAKKGKGLTFLIQEKYPDAIGLLREATQAEADDVDAWVWYGQALLNAGKHAEARDALQHALKLDASNKPAQESLQLLNSAQGSR